MASLAAAGLSWRRARRLRADLAAAQRRLELLGAPLGDDGEERRAVGAAALRRDERLKFDTDEEGYYRRLRKLLLADFRDVAGADEAVFWRWNETNDGLVADSWSSDGSTPEHFDFAEWGPLVQWSAETGVIQTVGHEELVIVGAACVLQEESVIGVLTLTRADGLALPRPSLKAWMPRMAAQLGAFKELVDVRKSYGRHMRQSQALLDAVQRLQGFQKGEGLARALCETALEVSAGRGATLIRWYPESDRGEIHHATAGTGLAGRDGSVPSIALGARSLVADACRNGAPHVLDDARAQGSGEDLYGVRRRLGNPGAVAILPLTKGDRVLGALVIEADAPAGLTLDEIRPLAVLGVVVASSL
ncbi:MAG TPA: GAF domain-containing protein, partial [Gemmatimonadaceae bacterium]|nr:GAF domain-containing protein [Gemmatimonadaceae bacterium]